MDLREIEVFVAVAEDLHFGHAAERLNLAQPSVSESVRRLESRLGGPLFTRTSRRVALTSLGDLVLPEARRALDSVRRVYDVGRAAARDGVTTLRLGLAGDVGHEILGPALREFARAFPDVPVDPQQVSTADQVAELLERRLHVGLAWEPPVVDQLTSTVVGEEPYAVFVRRDHIWSGRDDVDPADLAGVPLVPWSPALNRWTYEHFMATLSSHGVEAVVAATAMSMAAQIPLVVAGRGVGVTAAVIARSIRDDEIVALPLRISPGARRVALRHRDDRTPTTAALVAAFERAGANPQP